MLTLLIETSTERGAVFLFKDKALVYESYLPPGLHNSTDLMPAVQKGLMKIGAIAADINLIGVGVGPGSYTGLRVGAMAAKTISYACKIPLVGLCTLACFAPRQQQPYAVIIDAKMGGVYLQLEFGSPMICALQELYPLIENVPLLVTPNSKVLSSKLAQLYPDCLWQWEELPPDPQAMLAGVLQKFNLKQYTLDGSVELLYMRKAQAEIEKDLRNFRC